MNMNYKIGGCDVTFPHQAYGTQLSFMGKVRRGEGTKSTEPNTIDSTRRQRSLSSDRDCGRSDGRGNRKEIAIWGVDAVYVTLCICVCQRLCAESDEKVGCRSF